jgi:hypothetical protein
MLLTSRPVATVVSSPENLGDPEYHSSIHPDFRANRDYFQGVIQISNIFYAGLFVPMVLA